MDFLIKTIRWELVLFLGALTAIVAFQLLTHRINTDGLLRTKLGSARGTLSPDRVQLLLTTLGAAVYYVLQAADTAKSGNLPNIPNTWPAVLGGSNLIYLGGKAYARFFSRDSSK